jgi:hypothetical protein
MSDFESPFKHLTHEIKLDRSYYSMSHNLLCWLHDNVGPGHAYKHVDDAKWQWDQVHGLTWITFKHEADYVQFKLTWC